MKLAQNGKGRHIPWCTCIFDVQTISTPYSTFPSLNLFIEIFLYIIGILSALTLVCENVLRLILNICNKSWQVWTVFELAQFNVKPVTLVVHVLLYL